MTTQDDLRRIALLLPQAAESDNEFGCRVAGRQFVPLWREQVDPKEAKVANAEVIVVQVVDLGEKEALLACDPAKFFTTDHDDGYTAGLAGLPEVDVQELAELVGDSWRLRAPAGLVEELDRSLTGSRGGGAVSVVCGCWPPRPCGSASTTELRTSPCFALTRPAPCAPASMAILTKLSF